jgi:hypothetical protein
VSKAALPGSNAIIGGIVTRLEAAPASRHLSARPSLHHRVQVFRSHATAATAAAARAQAAAAAAAAAPTALPAMAALPFDDIAIPAAPAAAATAASIELFGPPNLSKAAAPPLLPAVTGSGYGPPEGARRSSGSFSSSASGSPLTPASAKPSAAAAPAALDVDAGADEAAVFAPDEEWMQALPRLDAGREEEEAELLEGLLEDLPMEKEKGPVPASAAAPKGKDAVPPLPFALRSAEEAEMWQDVMKFYLGEGEGTEATTSVAPGAAAVARVAEEAEPGFGWGR